MIYIWVSQRLGPIRLSVSKPMEDAGPYWFTLPSALGFSKEIKTAGENNFYEFI